MRPRSAQAIGIFIVTCGAVLMLAVGVVPAGAATGVASTVGIGWTLTRHAPPQATSAAGGIRVRVSPKGNNRHFTLVRYDAANAITDQVRVAPRGHVVNSYIDDTGRVVVVATRPHTVFALVW